jgi:hypothetical protein
MVALLEASQQTRRILLPICRMLAVEASLLRPRAAAADPAVPGAVGRVRGLTRVQVREVVEPERIPLPRGVLAAARQQGF